jgi:glutathione S-transferase
MIKLYTFPEAFGLRNVSPFCLKVEMALEHLGLDYEIVMESDPRKSPKGKLPYIVDEGLTIADSELILEYLDAKADGRLYGDVSDQEHATGLAFTRLIEDHLYWMVVASRWLDDDWFHNVREGFFSNLPPVIKTLVARCRYLCRALDDFLCGDNHSIAIGVEIVSVVDGDITEGQR